jgi:hypothetical protein
MFNMEDVKTMFAVYYEEEGYMAYLRVDEMVTWLSELKVKSSTELLTHVYARSGIVEDVPISWEQLLYILSGHAVSKNAALSDRDMAAGYPPATLDIDAETERLKETKDLTLLANNYIEAGRIHDKVGELETEKESKLADMSMRDESDLDELMRQKEQAIKDHKYPEASVIQARIQEISAAACEVAGADDRTQLEDQIQTLETERDVHVRNNAFEKAACLHAELLVLRSKLICLTESNDNPEIDAMTKTLAEASERKSHLINTNQYEAAGAVHIEILAGG